MQPALAGPGWSKGDRKKSPRTRTGTIHHLGLELMSGEERILTACGLVPARGQVPYFTTAEVPFFVQFNNDEFRMHLIIDGVNITVGQMADLTMWSLLCMWKLGIDVHIVDMYCLRNMYSYQINLV